MEGPIVARSVRRGGSLAVGAGVEVATGRGGLAGVGSGWEGFGGSSRFQAIETSPSQRCEVAAARVWAPGEDVKTVNRVLAIFSPRCAQQGRVMVRTAYPTATCFSCVPPRPSGRGGQGVRLRGNTARKSQPPASRALSVISTPPRAWE